MPAPPDIHCETVNVRDYERDVSGNIPLWTLCNYLQMAAANHAHELGCAFDQLSPMGLTWVLTRLDIRLHTPPLAAKSVEIETWPCGLKALSARRDFRIKLPGSDRSVATATSMWVMLRLDTRRPARVPRPIASRIPFTPPLHDEERWDSIGDIKPGNSDHLFPVRLADIDINRHVNNVRYLEWAAEAVTTPENIHDTTITGARMEYLNEAHLGDTVRVSSTVSPVGIHSSWHNLYRVSDRELLTRIELHTHPLPV